MHESLKYGIPENDFNSIISILNNHVKIEQAILFGSRAKGNFTDGSDIDIALVGKDLKITDVFEISEKTDQLFLPWKIDYIIFSRIVEGDLIEHIERVGIKLIS